METEHRSMGPWRQRWKTKLAIKAEKQFTDLFKRVKILDLCKQQHWEVLLNDAGEEIQKLSKTLTKNFLISCDSGIIVLSQVRWFIVLPYWLYKETKNIEPEHIIHFNLLSLTPMKNNITHTSEI